MEAYIWTIFTGKDYGRWKYSKSWRRSTTTKKRKLSQDIEINQEEIVEINQEETVEINQEETVEINQEETVEINQEETVEIIKKKSK